MVPKSNAFSKKWSKLSKFQKLLESSLDVILNHLRCLKTSPDLKEFIFEKKIFREALSGVVVSWDYASVKKEVKMRETKTQKRPPQKGVVVKWWLLWERTLGYPPQRPRARFWIKSLVSSQSTILFWKFCVFWCFLPILPFFVVKNNKTSFFKSSLEKQELVGVYHVISQRGLKHTFKHPWF